MTTPNTEPKPATDAEIAFHFASNPLKAKCLDCDPDDSGEVPGECNGWGCGFVATLLARIEQEREMRRELQSVLLEIVAWGIDHDGACPEDDTCDCPRVMRVNSALARAAKMEADYGK